MLGFHIPLCASPTSFFCCNIFVSQAALILPPHPHDVNANRERQHPGIVDGQTLPPRNRGAGFMFFNDEGDECGGFVYSGEKGASDMGFSLDQLANDQILQLQYGDEVRNGARKRHYGLKMWDRNDEMTTGRLMHMIDSLKAFNDTALISTTIARLRAEFPIGPESLCR